MSKLIIRNDSSLPDTKALTLVDRVVSEGRVSEEGKSYCFATLFTVTNPDTMVKTKHVVVAQRNKCSDTFTVYDQ